MEIQINHSRLAMKLHIYIMIHVTSRTHSWRESNIFLHEFTVSPFIRAQFWLDYVFFQVTEIGFQSKLLTMLWWLACPKEQWQRRHMSYRNKHGGHSYCLHFLLHKFVWENLWADDKEHKDDSQLFNYGISCGVCGCRVGAMSGGIVPWIASQRQFSGCHRLF